MSDLAGFLGTVGIFSLLATDEAARVGGYLDPVSLTAGDVLFREGDPGDDLYIIRSGRIRIGSARAELETRLSANVTMDDRGELVRVVASGHRSAERTSFWWHGRRRASRRGALRACPAR
jgi:CRP-like cAMP-binding protein